MIIKKRFIVLIILLVIANTVIYSIRQKQKYSHVPKSYNLEYGTLIDSKLKKIIDIDNSSSKLTVVILLHAFLDNYREIIWANLLQRNYGDYVNVKLIFDDEYGLTDGFTGNELPFQVDRERQIFTSLGNLGTARYKVTIIKDDTICYNNMVGTDIILEAGEIIKSKLLTPIRQENGMDFSIRKIVNADSIAFADLLKQNKYLIYFNAACSNCQIDNVLKVLLANSTLAEKTAVIFSGFNRVERLKLFLENKNLKNLKTYVAPLALCSWFDIAEEPTIYKNSKDQIIQIPKDRFIIQTKGISKQ